MPRLKRTQQHGEVEQYDESSHMFPDPTQGEEDGENNEQSTTPTTEATKTTQQQQQEDDEDDAASENNVKYRRYLIDRTNGTSRLAPSKPPCSACFVPLPVVWFADLIEQNCVFERLGSFGMFDACNLRARKICIGLGLICNILSTGLSAYVLFAISTKFELLYAAGFTTGSVSTTNYNPEWDPNHYRLRIGMKAVAVRITNRETGEVTEEVTLFEDFCDVAGIVVPDEDCSACDDNSSKMIFTLFVSFFMCFPSITTSVLRLYPHYDCNCQKVFASFAAVISVAFAIYTFVIYQFKCFKSFGFGTICIDQESGAQYDQGNTNCEVGDIPVQRLFFAGPGWIALSIACGLKILDMLFNFVIPTPTICRDREEQRQYELLVKHEDGED